MQRTQYDAVIVGAGPNGLAAAVTLRSKAGQLSYLKRPTQSAAVHVLPSSPSPAFGTTYAPLFTRSGSLPLSSAHFHSTDMD